MDLDQESNRLKKPNCNAVLKMLPQEKQQELFDYLRTHFLREAKAWLAAQGITTSTSALFQFYHWYPIGASVYAAGEIPAIVEEVVRARPDFCGYEQELREFAQAAVEAQALQLECPKLFWALRRMHQQVRLREIQVTDHHKGPRPVNPALTCAEARLALLEAREAEAIATMQSTELNNEQQIARIQELFEC